MSKGGKVNFYPCAQGGTMLLTKLHNSILIRLLHYTRKGSSDIPEREIYSIRTAFGAIMPRRYQAVVFVLFSTIFSAVLG